MRLTMHALKELFKPPIARLHETALDKELRERQRAAEIELIRLERRLIERGRGQ